MLDGLDGPYANHDISLAREYRRRERGNVLRAVLVVRIGVHDDVRPELQGCPESRHVGPCEPLVALEADDMVHAAFARHLHGGVGASVVHDKPLYFVESAHLAGKLRQGRGEGRGLVVAGNLDDEFQFAPSFMYFLR